MNNYNHTKKTSAKENQKFYSNIATALLIIYLVLILLFALLSLYNLLILLTGSAGGFVGMLFFGALLAATHFLLKPQVDKFFKQADKYAQKMRDLEKN